MRRADVYILSAKHGLIHSEQEIDPYDLSLNDLSTHDVIAWARTTGDKISNLQDDSIVLLSSHTYGVFMSFCNKTIADPLRGLSTVKRLKWLKDHMVP